MTFLSSFKHKLLLFNIMLLATYLVIAFKGIRDPNAFDIVLLALLPVATYILIKKLYEELG